MIEYLGELIRQKVADEREKKYEQGGNFSSYMVRSALLLPCRSLARSSRLHALCFAPFWSPPSLGALIWTW